MYIKLTFHPDLKPFLLQLKRDFTKLDIRSYKFLHTSTSIRLYHVLKTIFMVGIKHHPQLSLAELKEMLGVSDKYNPYNNFKQRVLDEAQRRLAENTDIKFAYEEVKERKKVVGLVFHIAENQPSWLTENRTVDGEAEVVPQTFFEEMFLKVEKWGVSREVLTLFNRYSNGGSRASGLRLHGF
ncbi:MAG: replication initiation protein [Saprospiraceae bacterium]|nr:replication initiation protein [Saprospiraceae bacterium]